MEYFKDKDASPGHELDVIWRRYPDGVFEVRGDYEVFGVVPWERSVCDDRDFDREVELLDESEVPSWAK
jgi:hypothetical protein